MRETPAPIVRSPEELLGPLSERERLNAPSRLYLAGDLGLLRGAPRVAVVGSRRPSEKMLRLGRPVFLPRAVVETPGLDWPRQMLDRGARVVDDPAGLLDALPGWSSVTAA